MATPELLRDLLLHDSFLRSLARELVGEAARAEDLAQEVWVRTLRSPPRSGRSLRGWLAAVAQHLAANARRGLWRRTAREQAAARPEGTPSTAEVLAREHTRQQVVRAVLGLEEPFREVVLLRFYEGLPPRAIARRLGVPGATVRSRLLRGLERLRGRLDALHGGDRSRWFTAVLPWLASRPAAPLSLTAIVTMKKLLLIPAAALALLAATLVFMTYAEAPLPDPLPGAPSVASPESAKEGVRAEAPAPDTARESAQGAPAAAAPRPAPTAPRVYPAVRGRGVLTGTVVTAGDTPVAGLTVVARPVSGYAPPGLWIGEDRQDEHGATTDAQGRFELVEVEAGPTRITAAREPGESASQLVIVSAVEANAALRLVLAPTVTRGDHVGILVVDGDGQPVPEAQVELHGWSRRSRERDGPERLRDEALFIGRTDARGRTEARLLGLQSGVVWARGGDGRVGRATLWDLGVDPITVRVVLVRPGAVRGRLHGPGLGLLQGATLWLHDLAHEIPYYTAGGRRLAVPLRGEEFVVEGVPPGRYGFTLEAPRGARLRTDLFQLGGHAMPNTADPPRVEVVAGKTVTAELEVVAGGSLEGRVAAAGQPVAGARVRAVLAPRSSYFTTGFVLHGAHVWRLDSPTENGPDHPLTHRLAWTDPQGRYQLPGLQPGRYRLELCADGLAFERRMDVEVQDGVRQELVHELVPAGVLQVAASNVTYLGVLAQGARTPVALAITRDDFATFPGLAAGTYAVARFHSDERVAPQVLGEAEVAAGRTTWLDLRTASVQAWITGRVLAGGEPVAGAGVTLHATRVLTDPQGVFRIGVGHPIHFRGGQGSQLLVDHRGLRYSFAPQSNQAETRLELELVLGAHEVALLAVDGRGAPVPAQVELGMALQGEDPSVRLIQVRGTQPLVAGERTTVGPLPAGVLTGVAEFAGGLRVPFQSPVPRAEPLRIQEPPRGRVRVAVLRGGKPAPGVRVIAATWLGPGPAPARADEFHGPVATRQERTGDDGTVTLDVVAGELGVHTTGGFMAGPRPGWRGRVEAGAEVTATIEL